MNNLDIFEKGIKKVLDNYEMPKDSGAWEAFVPGLAGIGVVGKSFISNFILSGAMVGGIILFINQDFQKEQVNPDHTEIAMANEDNTTDQTRFIVENEIISVTSDEDINDGSTDNEDLNTASENKEPASSTKSNPRKVKVAEKEKGLDINDPITTTRYVGKNFKLNAPLSFTPNGDGNSDLFMPNALRKEDRFKLFVYDSENELVFKSSDINQAWDGENDITHEKAPAGTYNWRVELIAKNKKNLFEGKVSLVR